MNRVQARLLAEIIDEDFAADRMNDWENGFINDLYDKDPETLTSNQNSKLIQIHKKVVFDR